jgi:hypothetical protein
VEEVRDMIINEFAFCSGMWGLAKMGGYKSETVDCLTKEHENVVCNMKDSSFLHKVTDN